MDEALPYEYFPLSSGNIRLLCKDDEGELSDWSLTQTTLEDAPAFFAISYVWGIEKPTEGLLVRRSALKVTRSLLTLLHQLEARHDVRYLWIDQVCINQHDDLEKAVQVKLMREIYVSAQKVLLWLGPSTNGSDLAMDKIAPLDRLIGVLPHSRFERDKIPSLLPDQEDLFWPGLVDLYARPWYDRLWVLQEAILAEDIEVLCGNRSMHWVTFASFATKIYKLMPGAWSLASKAHWPESNDPTQTETCGFVSIRDIDTMRTSEAEGYKPSFWTYLSMGQKCKVTNPLDRVYGLMGLLGSEEFVHSVKIRYDWEPWQGYLDFCKAYIKYDPDLALLSIAGCVSKPQELPSWCPNFDSPPNVTSIYCNYPNFCAGFKNGESRQSRIEICASSNRISVPGFRIDRVKTVTEAHCPFQNSGTPWEGTNGQAAQHEQYHLECLNLFKEVYPVMITDLQALFRSLIAGHLTRDEPLPSLDFSAVHLRLLSTWTAMASGSTMPRSSEREFVVMKQWLHALGMQAFRRFLITEAGRVGLGPGSVKKGDHVCVFYSAGPLYLLRYDDPDAPAELVGDAYVDGMMDLENMPADTHGADEVFTIC